MSETHTPTRLVILSGSLELSTGTSVPVRVILRCPRLTRNEEREIENVRLALHDLTPQVLSEIDACAACAEQTIAARFTDDAMRTEHTCALPQEARRQ